MGGEKVLAMTGTAPPEHQVFVSFRGRDVRYTFFSFLKDALIKGGVNVLTDEDAPRGKPICENILKLIRDSRIAVVIFSENYPESTWCLDELVEIEKRMNLKMLDSCPIFFEVETCHVKLQAGPSTFNHNLLRLEHEERKKARQISKKAWEDAEERFDGWRRALVSVASRSGLTYRKKSNQATFVNEIVEKVKAMLNNVYSSLMLNVKSSVLAGKVSSGAGHSSEMRRELMRMPNSTEANRYDQYGGRDDDGFDVTLLCLCWNDNEHIYI